MNAIDTSLHDLMVYDLSNTPAMLGGTAQSDPPMLRIQTKGHTDYSKVSSTGQKFPEDTSPATVQSYQLKQLIPQQTRQTMNVKSDTMSGLMSTSAASTYG